MYEIIKQVILSGDYELSDMLNKIKKNCVRGDITDEQETELIALAREHATPENNYAGIQSQVDYMMELLAETIGTVTGLKQDVEAIKKALEEGGTDIPEPEPEEPDGTKEHPIPATNNIQYYEGKYYTYNDVLYLCNRDTEQAVWHTPDQLVGIYFQIVPTEEE